MHITDLWSERLVIPTLREDTKAGVLRELVAPLVAAHPEIDADRLLDMLWAREQLGSTGIAPGVAIPHGKLPGLPQVFGVLGRHTQGVDFASLDGSPTHLFFLLVGPTECPALHLKALAQVSRLARETAFRHVLLAARDQRELYLRVVAPETPAPAERAAGVGLGG